MVLRDPRPDDAEALAQAFLDDPGLGESLGMERDPDRAACEAWLAGEDERRADDGGLALVITGDDDLLLGVVDLHPVDRRHRRGEVGIWLALGARGGGRGGEALRLFSEWAIPALGLQRLQLRTVPDNTAMIAAAQSAGYVLEGVLRAYTYERGVAVDNVMMAIVA